MGDDIIDYFGGTTNLPDDADGPELDLTGLGDSLDAPAAESGTGDQPRDSAAPDRKEKTDAARQPTAGSGKSTSGPDDESHWGELASSLGVASSSSGADRPPSPATSAPTTSTRRKPRPEAKPAASQADESLFGKGLLEEKLDSEEELRQKQLLSKLFVPTQSVEEDPAEVRQVDDVDFVDEDMVEFEVEELTSGEDSSNRPVSRRPDDREERSIRRRPIAEPRDDSTIDEPDQPPSRPRSRRDEDSRRRPRRDDRRRNRGPAKHSEPKVRSEVLPADEDFVIDPLDDETEDAATESARDSSAKSIKFPTWNEVIDPIIESNLARRGKSKGRPRRPNHDRGGRE